MHFIASLDFEFFTNTFFEIIKNSMQISDLTFRENTLIIVALGPPPTIREVGLREQLDEAGLADVDAKVTLVLGGSKDLPAER